MQYHLDTIPVWEAMEHTKLCPLCYLSLKCERDEIERSLGGSVMEPAIRIQVNERGICAKHHEQLFAMKNRLGHALLTDSHSKELLKKLAKLQKQVPAISGKKSLFAPKSCDLGAIAKELDALTSTCVICEGIQSHMERYLYTFVHLWKTDDSFRQKWESSIGICIPHASELLKHAQKHLNADKQQAFAASIVSLLKAGLEQEEKDLEWFTLKFDYRNQDKPWGNSKDALERTINRLRGHCIGDGEIE